MIELGSVVTGHRRCAVCGYALTGQPVTREPHYALIMVRCPECATVASIAEYPLLGRWANLVAIMAATAWAIVLLGIWLAMTAGLYGLSEGTAHIASERYADLLQEQFQKETDQGSVQRIIMTGRGIGTITTITGDFPTWWAGQDHEALLAAAGGRRGAVMWAAGLMWIPLGAAALTGGALWAVIWHRRRLLGRLVIAFVLVAPVLAVAISKATAWRSDQPAWVHNAALNQVGWPFLIASAAFAALLVAAGLVWGRPVARGLLLLTVPPSLRRGLAPLWLADGHPSPLRNA
jgi:hypothetical protein